MSHKFTKAIGLIALTGLSIVLDAQTKSPDKWSPAGPIFTAGRSRNLIVDKADPSGNTMFTGSSSSGIFVTVDGGKNWKPLDDQGTVRNISYMAQGPDNTIYAATGEGFLRTGQMAKAQVGTGLYKLQNNVLVQIAPASIVGTIINRIAVSPSGVIAVAGNMGILTLPAGGSSWTTAQGMPTGPLVSGQDVKFDNNNILYCTIGSEKVNAINTKVFKSTSSTSYSNFTDITPVSSTLGTPNYGRMELAIAPSNNDVIYASAANKAPTTVGNFASLKGLFVSYNGGQTWGLVLQGAPQLDPLTNGGSISSGDYSQVILVSPSDPNTIFFGGYRLYVFTRSLNVGSDANPIGTWIRLGDERFFNFPFYLHENIHDIKIVGTNSTTAKYYIVTDAGIYRSVDVMNSYQPFYKGLATGQFNSVSIEAYPSLTKYDTVTAQVNNAPTTQVQARSNNGFIGGTGGNGLTYFDGTSVQAVQETNYLGGEVYNAEFSKILPHAALLTGGAEGDIYRISDVRTAQPDQVSVNTYTGGLSKVTPVAVDFANEATNSAGTPFKLWENYGQVPVPPDSLVFYNDSARVQASIQGGLATLTTQTTFTFTTGRPNKFALIDSIAIRTGTVVYELTNLPVPTPYPLSERKDVYVKLADNYTVGSGVTIPPVSLRVGPASAASVTLDPSGLDQIAVTFTSPPFVSRTTLSYTGVQDPSVYYKVFATIFYKYKVNDTVTITDNSISTKSFKYSIKLNTPLRWSQMGNNGPKPLYAATNPVQKVAARVSARLATVYKSNNISGGRFAVVVSKAPLSLNEPLNFVKVSADGALTTDATGAPTNNVISIPGKPVLLEWSKGGTELYYATDDNNLYRVSNLGTLLDNSPSSYSGKLTTDIFRYAYPITFTLNPNSRYRTTLLGTFTKTITSISVSKDDLSMLLTFNDPTGTTVMYSTNSIKTSNFTNIGFTSKTGALTNVITYCSLMEKSNNKQVFVGTDNGLYYTSDISAGTPNWVNVSTLSSGETVLPKVQIFDIKQQTLEPWNCYNSGQIFVATNGRGVWVNKSYDNPFVVSNNDIEATVKKENNLSIYPNPTNGNVNVTFNSVNGETARLNVLDINGRVIKSENLGKLYSGQATYSFDTSDLSTGLYIVNISSTSGPARVAKLIVTK